MGHKPINIGTSHQQEVERIRYDSSSGEYFNHIKESYSYKQFLQLCKDDELMKMRLDNLVSGAFKAGYDLGKSGYCTRI